MPRQLPPMNSLKSFEAAARFLSFSRAADELHLTHGAVSRAVRLLEEYLGTDLFKRATRSVSLTATGAAYAASIRDVLDRLAAATTEVRECRLAGALTVTTPDSFAGKWLVPRLFRFRRNHGEVDVQLLTTERLVDFATENVDLAVRMGRGRWPGLTTELLMKPDLSPLCSPRLLEGQHPLRELVDLKYHTLIHDDLPIDWTIWLKAAGVEGIDARRGPKFNSSELALQAAIQGEGVVLGSSVLADDDIAAGRLIRPFALSLPVDLAYYIVYPAKALKKPKAKAFRDWLLAEAKHDA
jgi:LysR family transcriptional regulator, glycine cleavage system transcriptional activator